MSFQSSGRAPKTHTKITILHAKGYDGGYSRYEGGTKESHKTIQGANGDQWKYLKERGALPRELRSCGMMHVQNIAIKVKQYETCKF